MSRSPGRPLDAATRADMEPRFGHDFSRVRIHDDAGARAAARGVRAAAYTVGRDIAFAAPAPSATGAGRSLVAHELTHVVQQERGGLTARLDRDASHEREADAIARRVASSASVVRVREATGMGLARAPDEAERASRTLPDLRVGFLPGARVGPSPEEPEYWAAEDPLLDGQEIVVADFTAPRVDFVTEVTPGVGDQGDVRRSVPVYSWRMTPKALRAYLTHASGGALTPFEDALVDHWNDGRIRVELRSTDQGVLFGYYVAREIDIPGALTPIYGDTWYDSTGRIFQYQGRRDLFLIPEDPIMDVLLAEALPVGEIAGVAGRVVGRVAGRVFGRAWRAMAPKLRRIALTSKLAFGRAGEGLGGVSTALSGGESVIVSVEKQGVRQAVQTPARVATSQAVANVEAQAVRRSTATTAAATRTAARTTGAASSTAPSLARTAANQVGQQVVQQAVGGAQQVTVRQSRLVAGAELVALYERMAARKLPAIVRALVAAEKATGGRTRLAQLRTQFEALMRAVGNAVDLTPDQRALANDILREARELARADFGNLQTKLWRQLRADAELEQVAGRMMEAGAVEDKATGALKLWTQKADGTVTYESMNIEHGTRLSDNPWSAKDADNLIVTDAAQNQQFNEALRKYGGVWPTDPIEDFIIRHVLNRQGIDFRP